MSEEERLITALTRPGSVRLPSNRSEIHALQDQFARLQKKKINGSTFWFLNDQPNVANTRIKVYPT